jgi:periplasmic protein TonB
MRDPLSRDFSSLQSSQDSWLYRVRDNFRQLFRPARIFPSSANGAPLHLLRLDGTSRTGRAQSISFVTHLAMIAALTLIAVHAPKITKGPENSATKVFEHLKLPRHLFPISAGRTPDSGSGSGGGRVQVPATAGNLAPLASIQLVRPSLPPKQNVPMVVPPTIYDPAAAPVLTPVNKIGLPWMSEETNSPGPGDSDTIGSRNGHTMGDGLRDGPGGVGESQSRYREGFTPPRCAYCPDPQYTDEAREAKLQGKVTLRVLVGADGRAAQIRIVQGIGLGLDERAEQAIRGWKFVPAHDAAHRAVADWVTVEAVFRLF